MTTPQRLDRTACAGFTLIEALVATALMGLILAALATLTAQWLPNWNRGIVRVQRNEQVALGFERLVSDLAAAQFISASQQTRKPFFDGTGQSVTFVRTAIGPNAGPQLEIVRIAEINSSKGLVLVRTSAPFMPGVDQGPPLFTNPIVIMRAPYRLSFAYAGTDRIWREEWREQVQLPNTVRLTVRDATSQRALFVSSSAIIHADVPIDCITSKSSAECLASLRPSNERDKPRS
jgi:general secretion pathway protein J